jgi:hypothetical protein
MAISGLEALANNVADSGLKQQVGINVLKKALNIEGATAIALISAIPATPSVNLPSHLGQTINATA